MADVNAPARPNPLAHPTLREDELCHIAHPVRRTALCGVPLPDEGRCCGATTPSCGRPRCPECSMLFLDLTGTRRP